MSKKRNPYKVEKIAVFTREELMGELCSFYADIVKDCAEPSGIRDGLPIPKSCIDGLINIDDSELFHDAKGFCEMLCDMNNLAGVAVNDPDNPKQVPVLIHINLKLQLD
jgi:hypothetical protein